MTVTTNEYGQQNMFAKEPTNVLRKLWDANSKHGKGEN